MRVLVLFLFGSSVFAQSSSFESLRSGAPSAWGPSSILHRYDIPDPIGRVELQFSIRDKPQSAEPFSGIDLGRLLAGSIRYVDLGISVSLPDALLGCLPRARPQNAALTFLYIEPEDEDAHWSDETRSYVSIPFGRNGGFEYEGVQFISSPEVELTIAQDRILRIVFINGSGQRRPLDSEGTICPSEFITWALE